MGDHDRFYELISLSVDGALDAAGQRELEDHLAECAECRELLALLTGVHKTLDLNIEPPEALITGVMEGVERVSRTRGTVRVRRTGIFVGFAAAAAVLALAVLPKSSTVTTEDTVGGEPAIASYSLEDGIPVDTGDGTTALDAGEEDMAVDAIDGAGDSVGLLRGSAFALPLNAGGTLEEHCAGYYAVAWFEEVPREIREQGSEYQFSDGSVGWDISEELFERYSGDAVQIDWPAPDGEGIMAVSASES